VTSRALSEMLWTLKSRGGESLLRKKQLSSRGSGLHQFQRCHQRARLVTGAAFLALAAGLVPAGPRSGGLVGAPAAMAQNLGQRIVEGKVIDANSAAVSGATIFLQNLKSKSIRSYTSENDGRFRFTEVNMADDYDLWAEKGTRKSATKSVSSWDTRTDFQCELKLK
jgi:hypothetical protein